MEFHSIENLKGSRSPFWKIGDPIDMIERLHSISGLSEDQWFDLLQLSWNEYFSFRSGRKDLNLESLERLSAFFNIELSDLLAGRVGFKELALKMSRQDTGVPERYLVAARGRFRSTITAIDSLGDLYGWRLRQDILSKFNLSESQLQDPFTPISIRLITEICDYLHRRQFTSQDFFRMGVYSYYGNKDTILSKIYSEIDSFKDAIEALFTDLMPLFEANCHYKYEALPDGRGLVTVRSISDVASALRVKFVGSPLTCQFKGGIWASTALYFGLNVPKVSHPKCEHRGDSSCQYILDYKYCKPLETKDGQVKVQLRDVLKSVPLYN